ncbi:tyrosine-type recombinase/integrase [Actinokineospora iranica]|uniref:Site-specific recombinase XerD n=1 Tax=Actinokineospora iranica TaxID=1271860 RepID=A0A1G6IRV9_9PSEU|nr:tyrosine-type recombinase/integrase [Actinokineospora iranica]SDC09181.1 Site-specific recombinase XerD [Actinokineospora iranica]
MTEIDLTVTVPKVAENQDPGDDVLVAGVWPGVADPPELLTAVADWLAGYGNTGTRHTYAGQALGLPTKPEDIGRWATVPDAPRGWSTAVRRYAAVMRRPTEPARTGHAPPPAPPGRLRHLHWFRWCATQGLDPLAARAAHAKAWLADLTAAGAAVSTCDKMLGAVRALYDHLVADDLAETNPAALNRKRLGLTAARSGASRTITLADAEVAALYHFAGRLPRQRELDRLRARAVVALFTAGVRVSELCDLDRGDLHRNRGHRALRVHGKGAKDRIVYLAAPVAAAVDDYLLAFDSATGNSPAPRGRQAAGSSPLLVNRGGRRCTRQAIWELLRRIARAVDPDEKGLAATLHPHALRHYYVTTAIQEGAQVADVAVDVGHASVDTTRHVYSSAAPDPARSSGDLVARRVFGATD